MKKIALLVLLLSYTFSVAQENYKYVIVPQKFSFFKEDNKYNTNYLTKTFFEKEGFKVFYDTDELPKEIGSNRCLALFVDAVERNSMFMTKIKIEVKDCSNKVIYTSEQGSSREKEYAKAYNTAFRSALTSLKGKVKFKVTPQLQPKTEVELSKPVTAEIKTSDAVVKSAEQTALFAIPNQNGYKIVDDVPNVVYELLATSMENVYSAKKGVISGTFLKKNGEWFFEYYENDQLVAEKVNVKF
ncbi:hypothetical protein ACFSX9_01045 [Flavobacterium ardleyense]|uniref:Secreted protein n=1 Tax=Flavobacterium ardleyense TaxID=2038737 RepID=A0ABW5Z5B3_9FLAO